MKRVMARLAAGLVALGAVGLGWGAHSAQAQYYGGGYPVGGPGYGYGYGAGPGRSVSVQVGVGGSSLGAYPVAGGYAGQAPGIAAGGCYPPGVGVGNGYGCGNGYPSPAARQGYREGQLYYETGIAPNRPLSPAEARGFVAGERRAAATPWQLDPARQQGFQEGRLYWETGQLPNRPLSPAEAQGFRAGESRAASGYAPWY